MDYRSLVILSRCLQAPIPNLSKTDHVSPVANCAAPVSPDLVVPIAAAVRPVNDFSTQPARAFEAPLNGDYAPATGLVESFNPVAVQNSVPGLSYGGVSLVKVSGSEMYHPKMIQHAPTQPVPMNVLHISHPSSGANFPAHPLHSSDLSSYNVDEEDDFAEFQAAKCITAVVPPSGKCCVVEDFVLCQYYFLKICSMY